VTRPGLAPRRIVLPNGLTAVVKETRKTPIVAINVAVRAGSVCDPPDAPGTSHLLARVMDRGTGRRSAAEIADAFDGRGVSLTINVSRHLVTLVCTCLAEDFDPILDLVADIVRNPSLPPTEIATRKGEVVTAIRQDCDSPFVRASETLMASLYGPSHPYGRPVKGTVESVEGLSRDALAAFHAAHFAPGASSLVVVGDVPPEAVQSAITRAFGDWPERALPAEAIPLPSRPASRMSVVVPMMNKAQADIAYGFVSIARLDPRYYACWLANHVIGQYAIGGRLGDRIREREGMAYYAGTMFEANVAPGPLFVRAGVNPANVDRTIAAIDEELARARAEGLTQRELDESRHYLIGSMPRALETNHGIANFLQTAETFGLGLDYDVRLADLLNAVTLAQANDVVREYFDPARATIAIAGPYAAGTPLEQKVGRADT
jgi:zinc protease